MKKIISICVAILMTASVFAQSPEKMSYQAVVRDGSNNLVSSTAVGMQISILQGSASGTTVYSETQTPTTNTNGLVSLEIGSGTVVSGDFTTIDWANGPYFIKTETDPAGGTSYTITGTSQLLSAPYALYAKTSGSSIPGLQGPAGNNGADGVNGVDGQSAYEIAVTNGFVGTQAAWLASLVGADGTNGLDGQGGVTIAGTGINITGSGTSASPYVVNAVGSATLSIGQSYQGGIIFWLDATGQHGLIVATVDQSSGMQWYNGILRYTGTKGDGLYAGAMNTAMIIATQIADNQTGNFAGKICADYSVAAGGVIYGDWYLPSKYELNLLYLQKNAVGGFGSAVYWSSTEDDNANTWGQDFNNGFQGSYNKDLTIRVRAVRAF